MREITSCRLCEDERLRPVLDLGDQCYTGIFPRPGEYVERAPLQVVRCAGCGLVQLRHTADLSQLYGDRYGYRSGLNRSMARHLCDLVKPYADRLEDGSVVIDIGSNDGTVLNSISPQHFRVGIDPTAAKFAQYYDPEVVRIPAFFDPGAVKVATGGELAHLVISLAMFYDLDDPRAFVADVASVMAPDGVWLLELQYWPLTLTATAYDAICHEHLLYYGLRQLDRVCESGGLFIADAWLTATNGGSIALEVRKGDGVGSSRVADLRRQEAATAGDEDVAAFVRRVEQHRHDLRQTLEWCAPKRVCGYGASTKGNVLLQYAGIGPQHLVAMGEVNPEKFGCETPGTHIPIVPDAVARRLGVDCWLVMPWHFREDILRRERERGEGGVFLFPLPKLERVTVEAA